jgi:predicted RNA methylase
MPARRLAAHPARTDRKNRLGNTRTTGKEQYYTPIETANTIVARLVAGRPDLLKRTWIEPAGGTGNFIKALEGIGVSRTISYDIEPHHARVVRGSFLDQRLSTTGAVSVGNPPFGRNNSLSVPFFNHCAKYSDYICFIVPKSWRKWSVSNRLALNFHLIDDYDLSINYEDVMGHQLSTKSVLRTIVQTWERRSTERSIMRVEDRGVVMRATPATADVSLTIFGFSCGTVKTEFERIPNTTQMFLKLGHPRALEALQAVDFSRFFNNTAYTEALSLPEINFLLNEYIFGDPLLVDEDKDSLF